MRELVQNKKTDLPAELQTVYRSHEEKAAAFLEVKDYTAAEKEYRDLLAAIVRAQGHETRYHKGGPYHQIGYCLFLQRRLDEARAYFLYAFIEDCITEDNLPQLPAFKNLIGVYRTGYQDLLALHHKIRGDIPLRIPLTPEDYLENYLNAGNHIESVSVKRETNVFIGGNYRNIVVLRYVERIITECKLSPVLASNFRAKESEIYIHAMRLLQDCGSAIFEITFDAGHLMEIERALNFIDKRNILLLYQQRERDEKHYTRMLWGLEVEQVGYMQMDELADIVKAFLNRIRP